VESRNSNHTLRAALSNGSVWLLALLYFALVFGHYGIALWLPQILKGFGGMTDLRVGMLSALPFMTAAVVMVIVAKHSDIHEETPMASGAFRFRWSNCTGGVGRRPQSLGKPAYHLDCRSRCFEYRRPFLDVACGIS